MWSCNYRAFVLRACTTSIALVCIVLSAILIHAWFAPAATVMAAHTRPAIPTPSPVTRVTLPVVKTTSQFSVYTITNQSANTIQTVHQFYSGGAPNGQVVDTEMYAVAPFGNLVMNVMNIGGVPTGFTGDVQVSADQAIVGSVTLHSYPPTLSFVTPTNVPANRQTIVTVNGSHFADTPVVKLSATSLAVQLLSDSVLSATIPAGLANGWYTLSLTNPDGQGAFLLNAVRVDGTAPVAGALLINGGALDATSMAVALSALATDATDSDQALEMSFSNDGNTWGDWQFYITSTTGLLTAGDGVKTMYARFRDAAGNLSSIVSDTIRLDTHTQALNSLTVNDGALYTNQTDVQLSIGALPGIAQMQLSNDGGFGGAVWEPFTTHKAWTLRQYDQHVVTQIVYVRLRDVNGTVSNTYFDDIILDVTSPTGSIQVISGTHHLNAPVLPLTTLTHNDTLTYTIFLPLVTNIPCTNCIQVTLILSATDDRSGVGSMQISNVATFAGAHWEPFTSTRNWWVPAIGTTTVYVKFRDNANNESSTYSAAITP